MRHSDRDRVSAFVIEMNNKAEVLGMRNTTFINPSGLRQGGKYSTSCVYDLARMGVAALSYRELCLAWSTKSFLIGDKRFFSTITSPLLENHYPIIGGKTGGGDGFFTLVITTHIMGHCVVGAIAEAKSEKGRFLAMEELFNAAKITLEGGTPPDNAVSSANCACAILAPPYNPASIGINSLDILYAQNANKQTPPMSTTKIMTTMTFLDYLNNLSSSIQITSYDLEGTRGTSGSIYSAGDTVSIRELIYSAMLLSSNSAANAIARIGGGDYS